MFRLRAIIWIAILTIAPILGVPSAVSAQTSSTANVSADMVAPGTITKTDDLDFGAIIAGSTTGTVTINPDTGARTTTGGAIQAPGVFHPARFVIMNRPNIMNRVSVSPPPILKRVGGTETMATSNFQISKPNFLRPPSVGLLEFWVGATLTVGANQVPGVYEGIFTVTVNYN